MERLKIAAVIFDMDGLIVDSEPFWREAEIKIFKKVGIFLSEDDCRETMGYRLNEVVDLWFSRCPWTSLSKNEVEQEIVDEVIRLVKASGKALPGVSEAISMFRGKGIKLAVASSSPHRLIEAVLEKLSLRDSFDVVHSAQGEKYGKPHPDVFIHTAEWLAVNPVDCLVLEDSLHGVIAGLAAKMKVIAIPEHKYLKNKRFQAADKVLSSLLELNPEDFEKLH